MGKFHGADGWSFMKYRKHNIFLPQDLWIHLTKVKYKTANDKIKKEPSLFDWTWNLVNIIQIKNHKYWVHNKITIRGRNTENEFIKKLYRIPETFKII